MDWIRRNFMLSPPTMNLEKNTFREILILETIEVENFLGCLVKFIALFGSERMEDPQN